MMKSEKIAKNFFLLVIIFCWMWLALHSYNTIFKTEWHQKLLYQKIETKNIDSNYLARKSELMLKEYDSAFEVVGRETQLIYNFRAWEITLLALLLTLFNNIKFIRVNLMYFIGLCLIFPFFILEYSERVVIFYIMQQLRNLEKILDLKKQSDYNLAAYNYQLRDIQDIFTPLLNHNTWSVVFEPKVVFCYLFLITAYYLILRSLKRNIKGFGIKRQDY